MFFNLFISIVLLYLPFLLMDGVGYFLRDIGYIVSGLFSSKYGFPEAVTPIMEGIVDLHQYILIYIIFIVILVTYLIIATIYYFGIYPQRLFSLFLLNTEKFSFLNPLLLNFNELEQKLKTEVFDVHAELRKNKFTHNTTLEIVWTILPSIILCAIAVPSFLLLYSMDEQLDELSVTVKVIGNQWFWHYEYTSWWDKVDDITKNKVLVPKYKDYDSYMIHEEDLKIIEYPYRLLLVDQKLRLPSHTPLRIIVSSADVLHSFAIPSLGVKVDAVPGRLNQVFAFVRIAGHYYGQCSEICGVNHGFMPIMVQIWPKYLIRLTQEINY